MVNSLLKRIALTLLLICAFVLCLTGFSSCENNENNKNDEIKRDTIIFSLSEDGTHYIVSGLNQTEDSEITIPDTYQNLPVSSIEASAFRGCENLRSVTIPDSVTAIGDYVFSGCSNLSEIILSKNIASISNYMFYKCSNLEDIVIPNGVYWIGKSAFEGCSSLKTIELPNTLVTVSNNAFLDCNNLDTLITGCTSSLMSQIFKDLNIKNVVIKDGVAEIGDEAFSYFTKLEKVTIPDSVTTIGRMAFYNCSILESVVISENVIYIGDNAFRYSPRLTIYCKMSKDSEQVAGWHPMWNYWQNPVKWLGEW
ncbi:MAG: leucine-rich repeat protein [Alphaproteobacteria bacterium]|nr:leucine-rich repeat protein [Alphaproteobacteria bacterium]